MASFSKFLKNKNATFVFQQKFDEKPFFPRSDKLRALHHGRRQAAMEKVRIVCFSETLNLKDFGDNDSISNNKKMGKHVFFLPGLYYLFATYVHFEHLDS